MKYVKGDPNSLTGRALIYAHNLALCRESWCKKRKYPILIVEGPVLSDPHKLFKRVIKRGDIPYGEEKHYLENLKKLYEFKGDIIDAGKVPCLGTADISLLGVADVYVLNYVTQLFERTNAKFQSKEPRGLKNDLFKLIRDLTFAIRENDEYWIERTTSRLKGIGKGKSYFSDVANIIGIAQTKIPDKDTLLSIYAEKILATYNNQLEEAKRCKEKIEALLSASKPQN